MVMVRVVGFVLKIVFRGSDGVRLGMDLPSGSVPGPWTHPPKPHRFRAKTRPRRLKTPPVLCFLLSFFACMYSYLLESIFDRFPTQLGSQNPPKFYQKSIPGRTLFWLLFLIDFWLIFPPNFNLPEPQTSSCFISF